MKAILVAELDVFCIVMLLAGLSKERKTVSNSLEKIQLKYLDIMAIIFILFDMAYMFMYHGIFPKSKVALYVVNMGYYASLSFIFLYWYSTINRFVLGTVDNRKYLSKIKLLPEIVFIFLLFHSPTGGYIFYINDQNEFVRGPYNWLFFAVGYLYLFLATIKLIEAKDKPLGFTFHKDRIYKLVFPIPFLVFSTIQIFVPQLSITPMGCLLSLIFCYSEYHNNLSTVDNLSTLNNRRYITYVMEEEFQSKSSVFCVMMDINKFKMINDKYGHVAGDFLLRRFGKKLKTIAEKYGFEAARYGGDEFLTVCRTDEESKVVQFLEEFEHSLEDLYIPETNKAVSASAGYAKLEPRMHSVQEWICSADAHMYIDKSKNGDTIR